jgi:hypothetical protein
MGKFVERVATKKQPPIFNRRSQFPFFQTQPPILGDTVIMQVIGAKRISGSVQRE